ncbi:MAG: AI-2E family transporter [Pseudobdellovibrio sp.]
MELLINNKNISRLLFFSFFVFICLALFFPFLTTVAVAGIFAQVLNPLIAKIQGVKFLNRSVTCRKKCSALLLLVLIGVFSLVATVVATRCYGQISEFANTEIAKQKFIMKFSKYVGTLEDDVSSYIQKVGLARQVSMRDVYGDLTNKTAALVFDSVTRVFSAVPALMVDLLIFFITLYYLLADSQKLHNFIEHMGLFSRHEMKILRESLKLSCHSAVVSTVMAGLIHGFIVAFGAQLVGVGDVYVIFALTFFLSFIPVIGASLVALGLCAPALMTQNYSGAVILLGIALFASAIDNLIRPYFLVHKNHLVHPFISLLSVLGGIALFGMSGLFIGPVLVQVTFDVFPKLIKLDFSHLQPAQDGPDLLLKKKETELLN